MKKISVVIPTYKPSDLILETIASLRRQTFPKNDFEVLLVLNGCKEPYYERLTVLCSENEELNMRLFQIDDSGISVARNLGVKEAEGEYITFLDDDDWWSDSFLEDLYSVAERDNADIVVSNVCSIDEVTGEQMSDYLGRAYERVSKINNPNLLQARSFMCNSNCKLIRSTIMKSTVFDTQMKRREDTLYMAKISNQIKTFSIGLESAVYYRRIRRTSNSRKRQPLWKLYGETAMCQWKLLKVYLSSPFKYNLLYFLVTIAVLFIDTTWSLFKPRV